MKKWNKNGVAGRGWLRSSMQKHPVQRITFSAYLTSSLAADVDDVAGITNLIVD